MLIVFFFFCFWVKVDRKLLSFFIRPVEIVDRSVGSTRGQAKRRIFQSLCNYDLILDSIVDRIQFIAVGLIGITVGR